MTANLTADTLNADGRTETIRQANVVHAGSSGRGWMPADGTPSNS